MLQHVEGEAVEIVQDFVDVVLGTAGGALARRTAGTQRPDAAGTAVLRAGGGEACLPAGEAPSVSWQVVERSAERLEAERHAGRVEGIVGRRQATGRDRKRRVDAGERDARDAVRPGTAEAKGPERIE